MHNQIDTNNTFDGTPAAIWLEENCYRFGFVLRYPADKQDVTGIKYESWHFRYVGRTAATEMHELGMCLEEYLAYKGLN
jgi:D-alanyl-D-alanine carboxypeptidase